MVIQGFANAYKLRSLMRGRRKKGWFKEENLKGGTSTVQGPAGSLTCGCSAFLSLQNAEKKDHFMQLVLN
jgi:hypothetical protein